MRATDLDFPVGVRPLLFDAATRRRRIESAAVSELVSCGYREIVLPIVDFSEPYRDVTSRDAARRGYRFTDRNGELVAVRSDFTPMVARTIAPWLAHDEASATLPLRVFYRGDVIRCEESSIGREREYFQIGAEIVGAAGSDADAEAIRLAVDLVAMNGFRPTVAVTHAGMIPSIVARCCSSDALRTEVLESLATKNPTLLREARGAISPADYDLFERIVMGAVSREDLAERCPEAVSSLAEVDRALRGANAYVSEVLDDVASEASYYTGIRFRIYAEGIRPAIASGGRYDSLYGRFGADLPATGFTLSVDLLEGAK